MEIPHRRDFAVGAVVLSMALTPIGGSVWSQITGTIKMVVPLPPGSSQDIFSRVLADEISRTQGRKMVIESRPGASTAIGTEAVSRAAPDGKTLLVNGNPFLINPLVQKLGYDPLTSFEPVCNLATSPALIVVNGSSPFHTLADLLEAARAKPGDLTMASVGPGSATQIAFELLKRQAKVDMTFVPFSGIPPALNALLGSHVTSVFGIYGGVVAEQIKAGRLRALAVASPTRIEALPDVPTVAEYGYRDYEVNIWTGILAPAKTPNSTVAELAGLFAPALQVPEIREKLDAQGMYPMVTCGSEFGAFLRKQYNDYERIIRDANIKTE
jgi:tripartite-type tricarboxylate transporter receptor subunit TctC